MRNRHTAEDRMSGSSAFSDQIGGIPSVIPNLIPIYDKRSSLNAVFDTELVPLFPTPDVVRRKIYSSKSLAQGGVGQGQSMVT